MEFSDFSKVSVGVDCVILTSAKRNVDNNRKDGLRGLQTLLIKRTIDPYNNMWSIPGGLVDPDKSLEDTLDTRLSEKLNIEGLYKEQLYTYGDVNRDPRGRVVSVTYLAMAPKDQFNEIKSSIYGEFSWFWVFFDSNNNLRIIDSETDKEINLMAFDHRKILEDAILRLRNKVNYTDVAYKVMPEKFTILELQDIFEEILGKPVYSFRRFVGDAVEETDEFAETKAHRPAKLYRYTGKIKANQRK